MLAAAAVMKFFKAFGLDEHGFAIQQAADAGLTRFNPLVLAVAAGFGVMRFVILRFLIGGDITLVVAQDDLVIGGADVVVGHDGDLAAAAGSIHAEGGHGVAGGVSAQAFDDLDAF